MAQKIDSKPPKITDKDITGLKYFHKLDGLLEQLHDVGGEGDKAGNRTLYMDQYCMLVLLYLFNPIVSSLRGVQQASELKKVQKKLGCPRASLGSLSESVSVFDAERLKPIIQGLGEKLKPVAADKRLRDIKGLTLVEACHLPKRRTHICAHLCNLWSNPLPTVNHKIESVAQD